MFNLDVYLNNKTKLNLLNFEATIKIMGDVALSDRNLFIGLIGSELLDLTIKEDSYKLVD